MKNKTLAIFGIGTYILQVITSVEDLEGNYLSPLFLIAISGILTIIFTAMATIRLWKEVKYISIILASSALILFVSTIVQEIALPPYGSPIIILVNVTKVIHFIAFVWAVITIYRSKINL